MRLSPTTLTRVTRKAFTATTVAVVAGGMSLLAAGSASAATATADSCTGTVSGGVGDTVTLDGAAVSSLVEQGAREAKTIIIVHDITIWPNHLANKIADEQLSVGTVPQARSGAVGGDAIGEAVRAALDGSAGLGALPSTQDKTLDTIASEVADNCGLTVTATDYTAPTSSAPGTGGTAGPQAGDGAENGSGPSGGSADPTGTPGTTGEPGADGGYQGTGDARAARRDYSGIPRAEAPSAGISVPPELQYAPSDGVPGGADTPEFGILGADGDEAGRDAEGGDGSPAGVRNAGNADALATNESSDPVQLPMLLAVAAVAGVTAGLVRTWVLRRVS